MSVKDIPANVFINELAQQFKANPEVQAPQWADLVKLGTFNELAPLNDDWFYVRLAALARKLYVSGGGVGVTKFTRIFGGAGKFGVRRKHTSSAAPSPISKALQQLEKLGLVSHVKSGGVTADGSVTKAKAGRYLTSKGRKTLDLVAKSLLKKEANYGLDLTPTM